jgi:hypothetical protein
LPNKETLMEANEHDREGVEELDSLIQRFIESGCSPDGVEVEGDHPGHGDHDHDGVRRLQYRGHEVEIVTHYQISIDGEPWEGHVTARLDGTVTYHGLPQYAVPSAVALVQAVIDTTYEAPEDVRAAIDAAREEG